MNTYEYATEIRKRCTRNKWSLSIAESCTGGVLSAAITDVPGVSKFFRGGVVAYSNNTKENLLKVPHDIIETYGAVSKECCEAMAQGVRKALRTTYSVAITGIAGPSGATPQYSVGHVFISVATPSTVITTERTFSGKRIAIRGAATNTALSLLYKILSDDAIF